MKLSRRLSPKGCNFLDIQLGSQSRGTERGGRMVSVPASCWEVLGSSLGPEIICPEDGYLVGCSVV
jgi:hypothetical protein